jgi:multidrug resistance efflux pump
LALTVTHELADMRRHLWVRAPIDVSIDGIAHAVAEWSLGGIAIEAASRANAGAHPTNLTQIGRGVALKVALPFQGFDISFPAKGEIEGFERETGRTVIGFRDLGQRERELLSHFVEQLVRGNMVSVDDTIQRLGAPMAVAEFAAAAAKSGADRATAGRFRRPIRAASMTVAYSLAGLIAATYLGSLLYTNLFWLEAPTSTISAPMQSLVSLGDGVVTWTQFKPGDAVKAGDVVLKIADTILEREIEQAEIGVRERENKLAFLARRFENEKKRLGTLAGLSSLKSSHTTAEIESLNIRLQAAQRELRQLPPSAVGPLAQVRQRIVALQQEIALKGLDRNARANLSKDRNGSGEIVGQTVVGETDNLAAQIELAEADIAISQQRHQAYLSQRERLSIRAPFDGVLRDLTHADTSTVRKGDVAAVVERADQRTVTAFLRQDQLLRVQLGAQAVVHVPATRQTFKATVAEINPVRSAPTSHTNYSGGQTTTPRRDDGMAAVRLMLTAPVKAEDANVYRDGLPAVTMIGLSVAQTPYSAARPVKAEALPKAAVQYAGVTAEPAPPVDTRNWLRRVLSGAFGWGRSAQSTQLGG